MKTLKLAIFTTLPLVLFSGCFLAKSSLQQPSNNMNSYRSAVSTKLMVMSAPNDCYDCDTFTISIRR